MLYVYKADPTLQNLHLRQILTANHDAGRQSSMSNLGAHQPLRLSSFEYLSRNLIIWQSSLNDLQSQSKQDLSFTLDPLILSIFNL